MDQIFYVMAILGCSDGSMECAELRSEPVRYQSVAACQAAMPRALERHSDLAYPTIAASCRATAPRLAARTSRPKG